MKFEMITLVSSMFLSTGIMTQSNIDPDGQFAWCENIGWTNWRDADGTAHGVNVGAMYLSGLIWSENVGWINVGNGAPQAVCEGRPCYANVDGGDFGINIGADGFLRGLAWGENIGWINFDTASLQDHRAGFDRCERRLFGFAWAENIGFINLHDATEFVAVGPCAFADADCNGGIAMDDYAVFESFLEGPEVVIDCPAFDSDGDGHIDLMDFAAIQLVLTE